MTSTSRLRDAFDGGGGGGGATQTTTLKQTTTTTTSRLFPWGRASGGGGGGGGDDGGSGGSGIGDHEPEQRRSGSPTSSRGCSAKHVALAPARAHDLEALDGLCGHVRLGGVRSEHFGKKRFASRVSRDEGALEHIEIDCFVLGGRRRGGKAKVDECKRAVVEQKHVGRCGVAVNESVVVQERKHGADVAGQRGDLGRAVRRVSEQKVADGDAVKPLDN
eukprot:Amastigsp_a339282_32.p3 type:complete len:219 gc:universal Amastigsp_a339282_32:459-1115(+)